MTERDEIRARFDEGKELLGIGCEEKNDDATSRLQDEAITGGANYVLNNFSRIDSDNSGYIDFNEVRDAMRDPEQRGEGDMQRIMPLKVMYNNFVTMYNQSNDELGRESEISKADLERLRDPEKARSALTVARGPNWTFEQIQRTINESSTAVEGETAGQADRRLQRLAYASLFDMGRYASTNFQQLDLDGNGYIHANELDAAQTRAAGNTAAALKERAMIASLRVNYDHLRNSHNKEWGSETSGISREDLRHQNWMEANRVIPLYMFNNVARPDSFRR